ncbi:MAG TPA: sugar transferase [Tepidisphaeraceae bacterium]|nr:sugar transferase [Tepidisphaeraceae bacterium]
MFGLRGQPADATSLAGLGKLVARRARETDEVALVAGRFICAVLPDTPAVGGRRFALDVHASLNGQAKYAVVEVLSYPAPDARDANGHARDGGTMPFGTLSGAPACRFDSEGGEAAHSIDPVQPDVQSLFRAFLEHVAPETSFHRDDSRSLEVVFASPLPLWKRAMDVAVAGLALACLSPLLLVIAGAVRLTSGLPVIFRQYRAGFLGRPFEMYKFRTMVVDAERQQEALRDRSEQDGPAFKLTDDPRVTRLGRFLRKTSLDELPQLWNVLKGDMSLVGPRPLPCGESSACSGWQRRRLDVTPGITCIWQVEGRSRVSFHEWMRMDVAYVRTRRLLRDVKLLLLTIPAVVLRRGAR